MMENQGEEIAADKNVMTVCLIVFVLAIYRLILAEGLATAIVSNFLSSFSNAVFYSINFILPFAGIVLFLKLHRIGWVLIAFYSLYSIFANVMLFSTPFDLGLIVPCVAFLLVLYMLSGTRMLETFRLVRSVAFLTIVIVAGLAILYVLL